jgi:hypothetical protein
MTASPRRAPEQSGQSELSNPGGRRRAAHIHPPKIETFDLAKMTNVDPKGVARPVDTYRVEEFGLYLARPVIDRPDIEYVESWLLPELGARITDWYFTPGHERDQDFYLDIAEIERGRTTWRSIDHYLDIVVRSGRELEVLDADELLAALGAGLIDAATAERAMHRAYHLVDKIARYGYDLGAWFSDVGIHLSWQRR